MATFFTLFSLSDSSFLQFNKCYSIAPSPPHPLHDGVLTVQKNKTHMLHTSKGNSNARKKPRRCPSISRRLRMVLRCEFCFWSCKGRALHAQRCPPRKANKHDASFSADADVSHDQFSSNTSPRRSLFLYPIEEMAEECC